MSLEVKQIERIERQLNAKRKRRRDDATLHLQYWQLALRNKPAPTMDEIQIEFIRVYPTIRLDCVFACMQFLGKGKLRLTFTNAYKMENFIHDVHTFRGHPLELKPISTRRWVHVRYYPYGAPMAQSIRRRGPPFI